MITQLIKDALVTILTDVKLVGALTFVIYVYIKAFKFMRQATLSKQRANRKVRYLERKVWDSEYRRGRY